MQSKDWAYNLLNTLSLDCSSSGTKLKVSNTSSHINMHAVLIVFSLSADIRKRFYKLYAQSFTLYRPYHINLFSLQQELPYKEQHSYM